MKRLLAYLFIVLGLGLILSTNSKEAYAAPIIPTIEKCNSFSIGDTNWYYNNCDQLRSLKSGVKINKKEKVKIMLFNRDYLRNIIFDHLESQTRCATLRTEYYYSTF